jgi:GT2 family glycosyltransferase/spore maturation protein CgeB
MSDGAGGRDGEVAQNGDVRQGDVRRNQLEVRQLSAQLRATREDLRTTQEELRRTRRELDGLRRRRSVRIALALTGRVRPVVSTGRRLASMVPRPMGRGAPDGDRKRLRATPAEEAAFRARLAAALQPAVTTGGPLVSVIVPTRDGLDHVRRLLPALESLAYRDLELILVDNGSRDGTVAFVRSLGSRYPIRIIENADNRSYSEANNQGIETARGELILLLNNDAEPAGPHVLGHMVERLAGDPAVVAVGSRLIYPRRDGPEKGARSAAADFALQHRGIAFETEGGVQVARNQGTGDDPLGPVASEPRELELATAACLLVRRSAIDGVGGFSLGYDYGMEDVDLCLKLREAGGRIVYEPQATFWHHESATQRVEDAESRLARRMANRAVLADRWGPRIAREVMLDRLSGSRRWSDGPLHVGITLTRDDPGAGWGDWHTAHELGEALAAIGWRVSYLERWKDHWYEPDPSLDVVIALLDAIDVRRLPEGVVRIAWVRNWTDRWLGHPWFDEYDLVLASSARSKALIDAGSVHVARLMPLATNPERFHPPTAFAEPTVDVVFSANRWGQERGVETIAPRLAAAGHSVAIHGRGWDAVPAMAELARGQVAYDALPATYAAAALVVDDTATPTLPYGALNARVFDALATGTLVVTDNVAGAAELFGEALPAGGDTDGVVALVERYLADPVERRRRADELRTIVLERHTYARRATEVRELLIEWTTAIHGDVAVGPSGWETAATWGDYHLGRALQRALHRRGVRTRMRLRSVWDGPGAAAADVVVHAFGAFGPTAPSPRSGQLSVLWIISHPDLVTDDLVEPYDVVFAASDAFARLLSERTGRLVLPLHQATDPERFRPTPGGPAYDLLFVANSRGVRRRVVDALTTTGHDLAVFGRHWTPDLLDPRYLRGEHVPNAELPGYYSAAAIVLNDHWPDMAANGFLSNRLYDAAACGAFVISDRVPGLEAEFDDAIATFNDDAGLRALISRALADPAMRAERGGRARSAVLASHTFGHRADEIMRVIGPLLAVRPSRILDGGASARSAVDHPPT